MSRPSPAHRLHLSAWVVTLCIYGCAVAHAGPAPGANGATLAPLPARSASAGVFATGPGGVPVFDGRAPGAPRPFVLRSPGGAPLSGTSTLPLKDVARAYLDGVVALPGDMELVSSVRAGGGVTFFTWEQRFQDIPVHLGRVTVAVRPDGAVLALVGGELVRVAPKEHGATPALGDEASARRAAIHALRWPEGSVPALAGELLQVDRVWLATADGAEPAWRVRLGRTDRPEAQAQVVLDRWSGRVRTIVPRSYEAVAGGRVFPQNPLQPSEMVPFADGVQTWSVQSPLGWSYEDDLTYGNNVYAMLDREGDFFDTPGTLGQATGTPPVLDPPYSGNPADDDIAALTNAFWGLNDAHDRFRALGFDEPSGAFQEDNVGRGGVGSDRMFALVQYDSIDGTQANNAVFGGFGADGSFSWIALGLFETDDGVRDSALETDVLYHEYAHGVVTRLVGNDAACQSGLHPAALVEGWADFYAASFTDDPVIGGWIADDGVSGLRRASLDANTFTLFNFCFDGCNANNDGEIWSGALWDLRRDFIARYGAEEGVERAERLVLEGLRYTPCQPTFQQARDGILLADLALTGGADRCFLWTTFSRRGLGFSSASTGPMDRAPVATVDVPADCTGGASVMWDRETYGLAGTAVIDVADASPPVTPVTVTVTTTAGDSEQLVLAALTGSSVHRGSVVLESGSPTPGDGILQVAEGITLEAWYEEKDVRAAVPVTATMPLGVLRHYVYGNCRNAQGEDDDYVEGFWNLPRFLDAGEVANIEVTLGHALADPLENVRVTVTSGNPDVTVLPTAPIELGTIPGRLGVEMPREFTFEIRAHAAPSVQTGDTADLTFLVEAEGRSQAVVLTLDLNRDYVVDPDWSPFSGGTETFDPDSTTRDLWSHQPCIGTEDYWSLEPCAGNNGTDGYQNGSEFCGDYRWGQQTSMLISPSLFPLPPEAVALALGDYYWENNINLYTHPTEPYCDADMVAIFATNDLADLPCEPLAALDSQAQRFYLFTDNTLGQWVRSGSYGYGTAPQLLIPGADYSLTRLVWLFYGDIFDCQLGDGNLNAGYYRLDNFRFTYDLVRWVPQQEACTQDCVLRTVFTADPPGSKCDGEDFEIDASQTEVVGCPGPVRFSFGGPGVPPGYDWTYESVAPAVGQDGGVYSVYAQCEDIDTCNDYRQATNSSPALPGVGVTLPGTVRVAKEGNDLVVGWAGAAAPGTYGTWAVAGPSRLPDPVSSWDVSATGAANEITGIGEMRFPLAPGVPGVTFLKVLPRDPCTGEPRLT